jgi:hypothetical protein
MRSFPLLAVSLLALALAGCLTTSQPLPPDHSGVGVGPDALADEHLEAGHIEEFTHSFSFRAASVDGMDLAFDDSVVIHQCFVERPREIRVVLGWEPVVPNELEFGLLFATGPPLAVGPSPLVWSHVHAGEADGDCGEIVLRHASSGIQVFSGEEILARFSVAYGDATLPD